MRMLTEIYKALSEETRLQIMGMLLLHGELCVCDVEGALEITQSKSSRHLRTLLHSGLVTNRRGGSWMHYRIPKNLSEPHSVIIRTLRKALGDENIADLEVKLSEWFKKKERIGTACKAS
ncbi:MAG: metalloregulator ArsR/SmtB family transcription factor [Deltaproteobacteria bacterium]|nr:metalloregulator ArsR/SmtB family transcription factor [Deltaproteobacteria bacterium]MBW1870937.1 metalloregulator ArsR/SmtB family transcription factor [Deltaproteobacteria bacterium]